ncbi:GGDEF domain-containing protein [Thermosipho atlanticus]|uniref:GGDEF domain-containing protein n=1 Tax=Thermosipho atlanticus TaxID=238991 RepID=UPI00093374F3|nr:GGDEF domain-containing protein [Thermosipho atlanticus]
MLSNAYKIEQIKLLSITDHLTGIYNRRYFEIRLKEEIERAKRNKSAFSIILFDIDDFKLINDSYGHEIGDKILKKIVDLVKSRIRSTDLFFRWGGDEFIILLPDTDLNNAKVLAEQLRQKIYETNFEINNNISASFGITSYTKGISLTELMKKIDFLMYEAKKLGKNKICYS